MSETKKPDYDVIFKCRRNGCVFKLHYPPETLLSEMVENHVDSPEKICPVCGQGNAQFIKIEQNYVFVLGDDF